jgi:hypothetical protein
MQTGAAEDKLQLIEKIKDTYPHKVARLYYDYKLKIRTIREDS